MDWTIGGDSEFDTNSFCLTGWLVGKRETHDACSEQKVG